MQQVKAYQGDQLGAQAGQAAGPKGDAASPLQQVRALVGDDMAAVDRLIERSLHSEVALIDQLAHYIINSGGKRLRPVLALLSARACGHSGEQHHAVAAIVEFIHTATLLHDDVVDASNMRRGRLTANLVWGNNASVLVGDFLYSRAFQMMVQVGNMRVMDILAEATNTIAAGEVMQLSHCHDPDTTLDRYFQIINAKTAKLFEAACQLGAVTCGAGAEIEDSLRRFGRHFGTAYQLIDDVLDYSASSEEIGKNIGDDLAEGKPTLPLLHALWNSSGRQAEEVRQAIEKGGIEFIDTVKAAIESTGGIQYTAALAAEQSTLAIAALQPLAPSRFKDAMLALAEFAVQRRS